LQKETLVIAIEERVFSKMRGIATSLYVSGNNSVEIIAG
jgi:hypothetical protein